ncbi:MAG: DUF6259 domain-containing protein, partial [Planctomycetota bacterium]
VSQRGEGKPILRGGEEGLWHIRYADGSTCSAADFSRDSTERRFHWGARQGIVALWYESDEVDVAVWIHSYGGDSFSLEGRVTPKQKTVLEFALPARLRFAPERLERFICPENGNRSVGTAFRAAFFQRQPTDQPSGWRRVQHGPKGYIQLYGGPLDQREDFEPPVALRVTAQGRELIGEALAMRLHGTKAIVNRPPTREQADLVLVDSAHGPYFSASHLGGEGLLWRIGGRVDDDAAAKAVAVVGAAIDRIAATSARQRIALLALHNGPPSGGWTAVEVEAWRQRLASVPAVVQQKVELVELRSVSEMTAALEGDGAAAILNPYGEWLPAPEEGGIAAAVEAIGRYVRAGGHWFEVGGYPFYYALRPVRYFRHGGSYPAHFADFFHLDSRDGSASVYGVQPQTHPPWDRRARALFVPGRLACGGDERGGWCDRPFGTYVKPGDTWRSPAVRISVGNTPEEALRAYCEANAIRRRLEDKMPAETLARFRNAVLVKYDGPADEKLANLHLLPVPSLVHFSDYLKGGFDKEYPDHLPPHPRFGTPEQLKTFLDRCHALGHLVMPYTNPTWWCDKPKGPTFQKHGTEPLLKKLDGSLSHERYAENVGFTVCHWHPAVQAANRKTVRQFTEQYPVDILFQDQCGARGWRYDTNPASPTPYAYSDGLVSMVAEDSRRVSLSTESGWDRVVNYESQLCGLSWSIVPTEGGPSWRRLMKTEVPPRLWTVYPLAQHIAHDKTAMLYHDLGQFVTNREVLAWTLGLGFSMSYRLGAPALRRDATRHWLLWLDRLQKSVVSRYIGEPVRAFEHDRGPTPSVEDDGVIRAAYGPVSVVANLGPSPRVEGCRALPAHGFVAIAPGVIAANLGEVGGLTFGDDGLSFVAESKPDGADVWVYAPAEQEVAMLLPSQLSGRVTMTFDDQEPVRASAEEGVLRFPLPARPGYERVEPPPALADKPPTDWPGGTPAIAILDIERLKPVWTKTGPADWLRAFQDSRLASELGFPVRRIASFQQLVEALEAGPTEWLAIVNPYGEAFPTLPSGDWRATLDAIRRYVEGGGCWWETAGYPFHLAVGPKGQQKVGPSGAARLGLPVGGGDVDQPPEPLGVPAEGRGWLGERLAKQVERSMSAVNRGAVHGSHDPGHVTLVAGRRQDFIAGYRLGGWGWLWRIGGFDPNPDVVLPVAVKTIERIATHPPLPVKPGGVKYLWHATVDMEP